MWYPASTNRLVCKLFKMIKLGCRVIGLSIYYCHWKTRQNCRSHKTYKTVNCIYSSFTGIFLCSIFRWEYVTCVYSDVDQSCNEQRQYSDTMCLHIPSSLPPESNHQSVIQTWTFQFCRRQCLFSIQHRHISRRHLQCDMSAVIVLSTVWCQTSKLQIV